MAREKKRRKTEALFASLFDCFGFVVVVVVFFSVRRVFVGMTI